MPVLVFLEADLGRFLNSSTHGDVRGVLQLHLQEEHEFLELIEMLEKKCVRITTREEAKIEHSSKGRFAEIVRVLLLIFWQPYLGQNNVQAEHEFDRRKNGRLVGIQFRQIHLGQRIPRRRSLGGIQTSQRGRED